MKTMKLFIEQLNLTVDHMMLYRPTPIPLTMYIK